MLITIWTTNDFPDENIFAWKSFGVSFISPQYLEIQQVSDHTWFFWVRFLNEPFLRLMNTLYCNEIDNAQKKIRLNIRDNLSYLYAYKYPTSMQIIFLFLYFACIPLHVGSRKAMKWTLPWKKYFHASIQVVHK